MRDEDDRAREFLEEFLEPENRFGVEMVGWLVQQEQVRLRGHCAAESDATFLAAGQRPDHGFQRWCRERGDARLDSGLQVPPVGLFDVVKQLGHLGLGAVTGFVTAQPVHQIGRTRLDVLADGFAAIEFEFLGQITDAQAAPTRNLAAIGLGLTG